MQTSPGARAHDLRPFLRPRRAHVPIAPSTRTASTSEAEMAPKTTLYGDPNSAIGRTPPPPKVPGAPMNVSGDPHSAMGATPPPMSGTPPFMQKPMRPHSFAQALQNDFSGMSE